MRDRRVEPERDASGGAPARPGADALTTRRAFHGWYVVACCFVIALFGWGLGFYAPSVYLVRLREAHGWSVGAISLALTCFNLVMAGLLVHVGDAIARWGARRVILAGSIGLAAGSACLPIVETLGQLYVVLLVMALGYGVSGGVAINAILAEWFDARRGLAISLALMGASAAGIVTAPAMIWLTDRFGFALGVWLLIAALCALLWPAALATLRRPRAGDGAEATVVAGIGAAPPLSRARLLADRALQSIALAFGLGLSAQVGFLMHQVAFLSDRIGLDAAAGGVALTTTMAVLSRLATGLVIDRFDPRHSAAANFLVQIAGLAVLLTAPSAAWLYLGCALFGVSVGNMTTLPNLIVQREFASAQFARAVSLMWAIVQGAVAFAPGMLGLVHDLSGSYAASLVVCLALDAVGGAAVLVRRRAAT